MDYIKTEWKNGDVITADKLNNMEDGIESAQSGGSGGGVRIIDFDALQPASDGTQGAAQYEPGLTLTDFANTYLRMPQTTPSVVVLAHITVARKFETNDYIILHDSVDNGRNAEYWYYPESGNFVVHLTD